MKSFLGPLKVPYRLKRVRLRAEDGGNSLTKPLFDNPYHFLLYFGPSVAVVRVMERLEDLVNGQQSSAKREEKRDIRYRIDDIVGVRVICPSLDSEFRAPIEVRTALA